MTPKTETGHAGGFLLSEAHGSRSRENKTILSGQNLLAGAVLAAVAVGAAVAAAYAGNTGGSGAMSAVVVSANAKVGVYKVTIIEPGTNAGKFTVEDPDGIEVGVGTVAVAFSGGGLAFTIADATDFVAGDGFNITVAAGSGKYRAIDFSSAVGANVAVAVLLADCNASSSGQFGATDLSAAVMARDCEVSSDEIVWPAATTDDNKAIGIAALALKGIIVR